jgi:uncharacterized protein DUF4389
MPRVTIEDVQTRQLQYVTVMSTHPVRLRVERPVRMERIHVLIRFVLLLSLGAIGCSSLYWLLYLALPALAALLISQKGVERYFAEDAPRIVRILRWLAAAYAYLWLLTDAFPTSEAGDPVELEVDIGGRPTATSALLRLLYSLPALLLLAVLSLAAAVLWLVGAVAILARQRIPEAIADFLALTLCYQFRLIAYHLSLVERYPSFDAVSVAHDLPSSGTA